ncbi:hypothetical protein FGO68_gene2976 [Halteria grandinella]|uniref:Uncharacterized protein n=1 Tax=Halteria grandinella TaxID=5974 RepID=A0A8J8NQK8_HALGN|nr:hypothetical protein FGO68_gene2976 [Halteria grandinella]
MIPQLIGQQIGLFSSFPVSTHAPFASAMASIYQNSMGGGGTNMAQHQQHQNQGVFHQPMLPPQRSNQQGPPQMGFQPKKQ